MTRRHHIATALTLLALLLLVWMIEAGGCAPVKALAKPERAFQPVPEPATYGAIGVGVLLGAVAWRSLRRRSVDVSISSQHADSKPGSNPGAGMGASDRTALEFDSPGAALISSGRGVL